MAKSLLRDFRAGDEAESAILARLQWFLTLHGASALGSEIVGDIGHVTASAWIANAEAQILLVFGRKDGVWRLPGAHSEGDLIETARHEAARALGQAPTTQNPVLWALAEREIIEYWNTPAHLHFELIFRFDEPETTGENERENAVLPRGARWFSRDDIMECGDAALIKLSQKSWLLKRSC